MFFLSRSCIPMVGNDIHFAYDVDLLSKMDTIDLTQDDEICQEDVVRATPYKCAIRGKKPLSIRREEDEEDDEKERKDGDLHLSDQVLLNIQPTLAKKPKGEVQELTIQCPLCYEWFESYHIESHVAICSAGDQPQDISLYSGKEYLKDFVDIIISDFSDNELNTAPVAISHLGRTISSTSSSSSSLDCQVLTDHGEIQFKFLEPLSPIKTCINLFDLQKQGIRTYQDGSLIFDYLGQFSSDTRKSKSKIIEKQQQKAVASSQKSTGKPTTKAKWFAKKRFWAKRK
jgi:hypothetical protein